MTDERYVFIEDVKDKKRTARGAHNKRTHTGKGGVVKFPSDYLSKKERTKMNSECKSYKLNDPMTYGEFKQMPKDIQKQYLLVLINGFDMSNKALSEMFELSQSQVSRLFSNFGIKREQRKRSKEYQLKDDAFRKWLVGVREETDIVPANSSENGAEVDSEDSLTMRIPESLKMIDHNDSNVPSVYEDAIIPESLRMKLYGSPWQIFKTLEAIYNKEKIHVDIFINIV